MGKNKKAALKQSGRPLMFRRVRSPTVREGNMIYIRRIAMALPL